MKYRRLGNTGLMVSEISFGTIPILSGNVPVLPSYYSPTTEQAVAIMKYAFDKGCNLYDTAIVPEYGDAEIKLGIFASLVGRENIIISDKARFFTGSEMYDAVTTSCENLGTYADIYFVHQVDLGNVDDTFETGGAIDALFELKQMGKIKFVGVATHYYDILLRGVLDKRVDVLQGCGNVLERGMIDRVEHNKLFLQKGFLLNKVYAAGILPAFFSTSLLVSSVLSYPISSAIIGMGTFDEVDSALLYQDAYNGICKRLSFNRVIATLKEYFTPIPCDRCQRCVCQHGTEIHILLRQYNYYFLGKSYWALRKLSLSIHKSAELCSRCISQPCLSLCPRGIDIPFQIQKICKLVDDYSYSII